MRTKRAPPSLAVLLAFLVFATGLPLVGLTLYGLHRQSTLETRAAERFVSGFADVSTANIQDFLIRYSRVAATLTGRPLVRALSPDACDSILNGVRIMRPVLADIATLDRDQKVICAASGRGTTVSSLGAPSPAAPVPAQPIAIGRPYRLENGQWALNLDYQITGEQDRNGILRLVIRLEALFPVESAGLPAGGVVTVVTKEGILLARSKGAEALIGQNVVNDERLAQFRASPTGFVRTVGPDNIERLYAYKRVEGPDWYAITGIPTDTVFAAARNNALWSAAGAAAILCAAGYLAWLISRKIAAPIRSLMATAERVAAGDHAQRAIEFGPKEVVDVAACFNQMLEALRAANELLEVRITERTRELALANEALQAFSFSVAHDLRGPSMAVRGFAQALLSIKEISEHPRARHFAERIEANGGRMDQMIVGILSLARASSGQLQLEQVDMSELVKSLFAELDVPSSYEVNVAALPVVSCNRVLMRQVWANLISNAIKYSSKAVHPIVGIDARRSAQGWVFSVSDNGLGFDEQDASTLFGLFARLPGAEQYEGTGVGLMIVKRVVERHGGTVWAEGRPDNGATFFFSVPEVPHRDSGLQGTQSSRLGSPA